MTEAEAEALEATKRKRSEGSEESIKGNEEPKRRAADRPELDQPDTAAAAEKTDEAPGPTTAATAPVTADATAASAGAGAAAAPATVAPAAAAAPTPAPAPVSETAPAAPVPTPQATPQPAAQQPLPQPSPAPQAKTAPPQQNWGGGQYGPAGGGATPTMGMASFGAQPFSGGTPGVERCEKIECPPSLVGRLIGKQGETIKDLQRRSGARIQIDQNFPEGAARIVTVEGSHQCVEIGCDLVRALVGNVPVSGNGAGAQTTNMECPKQLVGRVIGKGGETINELQRRSGARIQIEQRVPEGAPCIVEIQGDEAAVQEAIRLVQEVMSGRRLESTAPAIPGYTAQTPTAASYGNTTFTDPFGAYGAYTMQQSTAMFDPYAGQQHMPFPPAMGGAPPAMGGAPPAMGGAPPMMGSYGAPQPGSVPGAFPQQSYAGYPNYPAQAQNGASSHVPTAPRAAQQSAWTSHTDPQGRTYWHNPATKESTWEKPPGH